MANAPQLGWATIQRKAFNVRVHQTWNKASMAADFYFVLHCAIQIGLNSPRDKNNNECSSISSLAVCVWFAVWLPGANVIRWRFSMDWCDIYSDSANSVLAFVLIEYLSVTVITESQSLTLLCSSSSCHWVQFGPKKKKRLADATNSLTVHHFYYCTYCAFSLAYMGRWAAAWCYCLFL